MNSFSPRGDMPSKPAMPLGPSYANANDTIDVGRFLGMLLDHKWLIAIMVVCFGITGVAYAMLQTPIYRSDALVQVEGTGSVSPIGVMDVNGNLLDPGSNIVAEVEILRSRMVLGKVVERQQLDTIIRPRKVPVIGDYVLRNDISRPSLEGIPLVGGLDRGFLNGLWGKQAMWGGESIDVVRFDVSESLRGYPMVLKVLGEDSYQLYIDDKVIGEGRVGENTSLLEGDLIVRVGGIDAPKGTELILLKTTRLSAINSLSSRLSISEVGAGARAPRTGMLRVTLTGADRGDIRRTLDAIIETFLMQNVERQAEATQQSLAFLKQQAPELRQQLAKAENLLSDYRASVDSIDVDAEGQSVIEQFIEIEGRLNELSIQEAEISQRFTRNHPSYQSLMRQKSYLAAERERLEQRVSAMPAAQQEVIRRTRDVEVTQAIYVNVLNKLQELALAKAGTIGTLRVIDKAAVGGVPIYPRKAGIVGTFLLLGVIVAIATVVLRALLNRGVETPEQLENLGYPVYAMVPQSRDQLRLERAERKGEEGQEYLSILANSHSDDVAIEAVRGLRTALHFAMMDAPNNCLMICGPSPDVGKSFLALNLSAVCVQGGQRVLVIDGDLRKGNLHRAFGGVSIGGLAEVLSGKIETSAAIRTSGILRMDYMSRGMTPPNPSELLMGNRFSELIDRVCEDYDLVIVDTPPVLAVTDAAIIGRKAGASLMVARFQKNPLQEIKLAHSRLETVGVEVRGCIINGVQRKAAITYGYGYYQYSYPSLQRNKDIITPV